jgi:hypothetical protein
MPDGETYVREVVVLRTSRVRRDGDVAAGRAPRGRRVAAVWGSLVAASWVGAARAGYGTYLAARALGHLLSH